MRKSKTKKLKGMTLIELLISVALLIIISLILVVGATSAVYNIRTANRVSQKTASQAPYAANRIDAQTKAETENSKLDLTIRGTGTKGALNVKKHSVSVDSKSGDQVGDFRYFEYVPAS